MTKSIARWSVLGLAMLSVAAYAADDKTERTEGLNLELTPYFWAAGIDGKVNVGNESMHFNRSFSDIWDNTDAGFMGLAVLSYNRFVLYADYDYLGLSNDDRTRRGIIVPPGTKAKLDTDVDVGTYAGGYRFDTFGKNTIDVMIGAQLTNLDLKLKVAGQHFQNKNGISDTVLMLRPSFQLSERWRFNPTLAYGVSGDSDTTYSMMPQVQYQFADSFALRFGYKKLYYKFKDHDNDVDISFSGPFLGVGWTFPAHRQEVAETPAPEAMAPPAAVAAAPAQCADSDHDGICDGTDQCPNTPPGSKVDVQGCACDFTLLTHFAFNSADLTAQDKAQLDQLALVLVNPKLHFITGEVDGYTDNTGDAAYNMTLSKRRAASVAEYLRSKGVPVSDRLVTQGFGETQPVADNNTSDGRAQNRRAVIRRVDCTVAR